MQYIVGGINDVCKCSIILINKRENTDDLFIFIIVQLLFLFETVCSSSGYKFVRQDSCVAAIHKLRIEDSVRLT
jgi:hypothetical protein